MWTGRKHNTQCSVLVISPLNALMVDQISKLKELLNVSVIKASREQTTCTVSLYDQLTQPSKIIFAHPEALLEDKIVFQTILKSKEFQYHLKAIVVDEAHLVIEWLVYMYNT